MPLFSVNHLTVYRYRRPVRFGEHVLMFRPRDSYDQRLLDVSLRVSPEPETIRWTHDVFGNCLAHVSISGMAKELRFETNIRLEHTPQAVPHFRTDEKLYPFRYPADELPDLESAIRRQFDHDGGAVEKWARQFSSGSPVVETGKLLMTLCYAIHEGFTYKRRSEHGTQPPIVTLRSKHGSCRDLLMMEAVRALGFGPLRHRLHLCREPRWKAQPGRWFDARLVPSLPARRWMGRVRPDERHRRQPGLDSRRVARDPVQAVPLSGSYYGKASDDLGMTVQVNVTSEGHPGAAAEIS
jgi:hypothetical protein